ncbi:hypothetical protein [Roseomonas sp. WA12]
MPILSIVQAKPLRPDATRLGPEEARRQAALLETPHPEGQRFPGDGGRALPSTGQVDHRRAHHPAGRV